MLEQKNFRKVGEKQSIMSLSMYDRDISPEGSRLSESYHRLESPVFSRI